MRIRDLAALLAAAATLAACVQGTVTQESAGAIESEPAWSTAASPAGALALRATMTPAGDTKTTAAVHLTGAPAGATYAWHIHYGSCENDIGIAGESSVYPQLTVGADGQGSAEVSLPFTTPSRQSGSFFVKVYEAANMANVVACAPLETRKVRASNYYR